ncbi:MAG: RidA family protein [Spirochaetota bacterium]
MSIYDRMKELGIELPEAPEAMGLYVPVKEAGGLLYTSGQGPVRGGGLAYLGKVGGARTLEEGQEAAKLCALNALAQAAKYLGDLGRITSVVKVLGFVASAPGFNDQPKVINGASQLFIDLFGDAGRHARSAIGVNELPGDITVEVEAILQIR